MTVVKSLDAWTAGEFAEVSTRSAGDATSLRTRQGTTETGGRPAPAFGPQWDDEGVWQTTSPKLRTVGMMPLFSMDMSCMFTRSAVPTRSWNGVGLKLSMIRWSVITQMSLWRSEERR